MSTFAESLSSGRFIVTAELNPPKGTDLSDMLEKAELLRGWVDAFNLTDSASAIMTMAPIGAAVALKQRGFEPILQLTGRDRNRIALQGDMLAAASLGIDNIVCMGGDPPDAGDHPEARGVFDMDTFALLKAAHAMNQGTDMMGKALKGSPHYTIGAVANPGAPDMDKEVARMGDKVREGAEFFQTQAVYEAEQFAAFMEKASKFGKPVIAGHIIIKSGDMARRLNQTLPGFHVPDALLEEIDAAKDKPAKAIEIGARLISTLKDMCQGVHVMAIGWESRIPPMLQAAGLPKHD
jgi:5,10-methylenetetrahydrofolate reductase